MNLERDIFKPNTCLAILGKGLMECRSQNFLETCCVTVLKLDPLLKVLSENRLYR